MRPGCFGYSGKIMAPALAYTLQRYSELLHADIHPSKRMAQIPSDWLLVAISI
jgi:hypothetical protein